jgi:hypothetical protein
LYKSLLGIQFLIYISKHLADLFLELSIALEYTLSEFFLIILVRILQEVLKRWFELLKCFSLKSIYSECNLGSLIGKTVDIVGEVCLHLDKLSSQLVLATVVLGWRLKLSPIGDALKAYVFGLQLSDTVVGLVQELLNLGHSDRGIRTLSIVIVGG